MNEGWQTPSTLRSTSLGDLDFNQPTTVGGVTCEYVVDPNQCEVRRGIRATVDSIPQGDGQIFHRRFTDGVEFDITVQLYTNRDTPACDSDARLMAEELARWLESMRNESGRYLWQPTGYGDERMMDQARWLTPIEENLASGGIWELSFTIDSPFPYVIDKTEDTITVTDGGSAVITNTGNTTFYPVIKVYGSPTASFELENTTTGLKIVYDSFRPGGFSIASGDYAEIDTFQQKIYLNGNEDNLKAGVDPTQTYWLALPPGANTVTSLGADADFLVNNAWIP